MRSEHQVNQAIERYADMVQRICLLHLKNPHDTEDIFQKVFLKYTLYSGTFENSEHEKAWLIRVALNACKDFLRDYYRKNKVSLETLSETPITGQQENRELLEAVLSLPPKMKDAIYLFYFEGYTGPEIGKIMRKSENTVYTLLARARAKLKELLGGDELE